MDASGSDGPALATEVLVVGAGPTGLVLALWLARAGIGVRIIDRTGGPGTTSRALAVHARTLELYRQLGIADEAIALGVPLEATNLWVRGRRAARIPFGEFGAGISAYPYILILPQDVHEAMLVDVLRDAGVTVERNTALESFEQDAAAVRAVLRRPDGRAEPVTAAYVAGCDGAHSTVREALGVGLPGGTYTGRFYVADVVAEGPLLDGELHGSFDGPDFLLAFPMREPDRLRLVGLVLPDAAARVPDATALTWEDVRGELVARMGITVRQVRWFSTYNVHHRVANGFRRGRAFLLGDAAHLHSPVGGQGMNTGIGDAVNLAWKLAAVLRGRAHADILLTYEPERIRFARRLVATTDRAFTFVTKRGPVARFVRLHVAPRIASLPFRLPWVRRFAFRSLSQVQVGYRHSALSSGRAGDVAGGDRLPWVRYGSTDTHAALDMRDWRLFVLDDGAEAVRIACETRGIAVTALPWSDAMRDAGFSRRGAYLVRPDGHVGLADASGDAAVFQRYLDAHGIRPRR